MKKIGITTFYNAFNYGAFLQCYALQKVLEKKYNVSIIEYSCPKIKKNYSLIKIDNIKRFIKSIIFIKKNKKRIKVFRECINNNFVLTKLDDNYDVVIAGSDQIWNIELTGGFDNVYTLNCFENVKKISYATSIGKESIIPKNAELYKNIINNIDFVSVREESAKKELEKIVSKKIKVNLDPTLLLTKDEWNEKTTKNNLPEKYIFSYFVGVTQENYETLNLITDKLGMKTISYSENVKEKNLLKDCYSDSPFEFITKIKNAEMVFTSSFHATVFSIIFNKKFYCMPPKDKGNRIINLLDKLGLSDRIINSIEQLEKIDLQKEINYEKINKKLKELRYDSKKWLINSIEG